MRVVITGSRGFVGRNLINRIRKEQENNIDIIEMDYELGVDLLKQSDLQTIEPFDVLIHLAARSFVPDSFKDPVSFYETNVISTLNALELCRKNNAKMIFTSSYVYGSPKYLPIDEQHPLRAFNPYAQSKIIGEELCEAYNRDFDVSSVIFRPFNIYGKGQGNQFLIPTIINQAKQGKVVLMDSRPKRDFIYIDDVVEAYYKAINYNNNGIEIFNLGSGVSTSINSIVDIVSHSLKRSFQVNFSNTERKNEVLETIADISKAKKLLNWSATVSIDEGIRKILL